MGRLYHGAYVASLLILTMSKFDEKNTLNADQWVPNPNPAGWSEESTEEINGSKKAIRFHNWKPAKLAASHHIEAMEFCGQLMGIAIRNQLCLPFNLASIVWKAIANDAIQLDDIRAIDEPTFTVIDLVRSFDPAKHENGRCFRGNRFDL